MAVGAPSQTEPDLFGYLPPSGHRRRRQGIGKVPSDPDYQLVDLRVRCIDAFEELARSVDHVFELFSMAVVDFQTEDNAGEIDRLIEELDQEIAEAVRDARHRVFE